MGLPIVPIVNAVATLANAIGVYMNDRRANQAGEKKLDLAKQVIDLQADLQKQTAFTETLTKQVEALAVQVQRQEEVISALKRWLALAFVLLGLAVIVVLVRR